MIFRLNYTIRQSGIAWVLARAVLLASVAMAVGGCMQSNSNDISGGEADVYVYKGRVDPLTTEPVADRTARLSERFKLVQGRQ